jgi:hypothetical protein
MVNAALLVSTLFLAGGDPYADRPRHPLAPSLPLLSKEENAKLEAVVDRFIQLEIGKLPKSQEKAAKDELYRLGPEAIFALVEGFNRAARIESSCAVVTIGKKIEGIVNGTRDVDLITYVRENVGAGLEKDGKRPLPTVNSIRNIQTACLLRRGELLRRGLANSAGPASLKSLGSMSMPELEKAGAKERGEALKKVLIEVERRQDSQTPAILGKVASSADAGASKLARALLVQYSEKQSPTQLKVLLKHESAEVRAAAARTIGAKGLRYGEELIALLQDEASVAQQAARAALVQLSGGMDFGPAAGASFGDRATAAQKWRKWWQEQEPN